MAETVQRYAVCNYYNVRNIISTCSIFGSPKCAHVVVVITVLNENHVTVHTVDEY